jgi:multidomain signaling protein FimX
VTPNTDTLQLLIFDTSDNTSEVFVNLLSESRIHLHSHRETEKVKFFEAIKARHWDILLLNDEVKDLDATECIACIKQHKRHTALVILTAKQFGIAELAKAYRDRITAVVSLDYVEYSIATIAREYQALKDRRLNAELQNENKELVERCHSLLSSSREAVAYVHDGMHVYANESYLHKFKYADIDDVFSTPFIDMVNSNYKELLKDSLRKLQKSSFNEQEASNTALDIVAKCGSGEEFSAQLLFKPTSYNGENVIQVLVSTDAEEKKQLKRASYEDAETGLYNRQFFLAKLEEFIQMSQSGKFAGGLLLYVKVNQLEQIRSEFGIDEADQAILQLAEWLKDHAADQDVLARFADNAFAILVSADAQAEQLSSVQAQWQSFVDGYRFSHIHYADKRASLPHCAMVALPVNGNTPPLKEVLGQLHLRATQEAVEVLIPNVVTAAHNPNDEVELDISSFVSDEQDPTVLDSALPPSTELFVEHINTVIAMNMARLFYQPVLSVSDIENEFYDIELRVNAADGQLLNYVELQQYIDQNDCGIAADKWQLEQGLQLLSSMQSQGQALQFMFTLTSATLADTSFAAWLSMLVDDCNLPAQVVILNVSQPQILANPTQIAQRLDCLLTAGFRVCISDFTNADAIRELAIQLNTSFVRLSNDVSQLVFGNSAEQEQLNALVATLHAANCRVIVANADNNNVLSALWQYKVDLMQGQYFQQEAEEVTADAFIATGNIL